MNFKKCASRNVCQEVSVKKRVNSKSKNRQVRKFKINFKTLLLSERKVSKTELKQNENKNLREH